MRRKKYKIVAIVGPTASGKSELAVKLAKKINGEIISADSRQIYRGLDIGSGKVKGSWVGKIFLYKKVPHYCIDMGSPNNIFTAVQYKKCAEAAIIDIAKRGKIPVLVGGTGFWVDAVVSDLSIPEVPPDQKLRKKLEGREPEALMPILRRVDPERARSIDQKNPRRIIRALEIAQKLGRVPKLKRHSPYHAVWLGLNPTHDTLRNKIIKRVGKMLRQGLVNETQKLIRQGVSRRRVREFGFEYRAALAYLDRKITRSELKNNIVKESLHYAKRQMRWFKRNKSIRWIRPI